MEPYTPCLLSKAVGLLRDATFVAPRARPCSARSASCRAGHSTGVCPRRAWKMQDLPGRKAFRGVAESVHRRLISTISTFSVSRPVPPIGSCGPSLLGTLCSREAWRDTRERAKTGNVRRRPPSKFHAETRAGTPWSVFLRALGRYPPEPRIHSIRSTLPREPRRQKPAFLDLIADNDKEVGD